MSFFAWCTVINIVIYTIAVLFMLLARDWLANTHAAMFNVRKTDLPAIYFKYLAYYKIAILVFNLVPYLALRIIA
jgi:hypothetical protein